jgi:exodeoxyribonuclease V alpha subunit
MGIQPGRRHLQGTPVMVTSNDHAKGLFNGDIGVLLKDCRNGLYVAFRTRESFRLFSLFELRSWEPAFAITVHKSQGSEYEDVLLVLPNQLESPLLAREVLYTGLTRARNRVFLYASSNIIEKCLSKKIQRTSRESLLSTR